MALAPRGVFGRIDDAHASLERKIDGLVKAFQEATIALDKIRDPRKRHREPDKYTELACVMTIADEALEKLTREGWNVGLAPDVKEEVQYGIVPNEVRKL